MGTHTVITVEGNVEVFYKLYTYTYMSNNPVYYYRCMIKKMMYIISDSLVKDTKYKK